MTNTTAIELKSDPIYAAGGLEMMAKHLAFGIDIKTAHWTRLIEVADDCEALLADARRLIGEEPQGHRPIWKRCMDLRRVGEARQRGDRGAPCPTCDGERYDITYRGAPAEDGGPDPCPTCNGSGTTKRRKDFGELFREETRRARR